MDNVKESASLLFHHVKCYLHQGTLSLMCFIGEPCGVRLHSGEVPGPSGCQGRGWAQSSLSSAAEVSESDVLTHVPCSPPPWLVLLRREQGWTLERVLHDFRAEGCSVVGSEIKGMLADSFLEGLKTQGRVIHEILQPTEKSTWMSSTRSFS